MLQGPRMVSYRVTDLEKAKEWYRTLLGQEPSFDSPMAVVFTVGGTSLALVPETKRDETSVVYRGVDDIEVAYGRLLANGGIPRSEIALLMLKWRIARVVDPFGNVVGILSTSDRKKPVEERPSARAFRSSSFLGRDTTRGPTGSGTSSGGRGSSSWTSSPRSAESASP